jgi:tetratricopeptide (TPR) repeat protein
MALHYARKRVTAAPPPGFEARNELVELLRRIGDHTGELATGRELLDQLLEHAEVEKAVALLQRLVVSHSRNPDLVLQLAELFSAVDDPRQACRFYRHAVTLLQLDQRMDEALVALDALAALADNDETIPYARAALERGQAVDWEACRSALSEDQRRRLADEIAGTR